MLIPVLPYSIRLTPLQDMDTSSDSPVTAIVSDHGGSQTFVAGFADGAVKVFDRRNEDEDSIVMSYAEHKSWVQNVRPHPSMHSQFLSGRCALFSSHVFGPY